jgi:serine/threonine protein kinase
LLFFLEFGYTLKSTEKSDVYSMGIVFMELVSGKLPTDALFRGGIDMVKWVEMHIDKKGIENEELIDFELKPLLPCEEFAAFQVLEIALQCTKTAPQERPSSRQVCDLLLHVSKNKKVEFKKMNLDSYN